MPQPFARQIPHRRLLFERLPGAGGVHRLAIS